MRVNQLFKAVIVATLIIACKEETPAPEMTAPPPQPVAPQVAQVPAAPTIVYAAAEPQHGGVRQKVGEYMVELAAGSDGKIDAYIQKFEGDIPSFNDVQVEMQVAPEPGAAEEEATGKDKVEAEAETEEKVTQDVIFYPKNGKLEGTIAALPKGAYDVAVKIFDIKNNTVSEQKFEKVELDPLDIELKPEHGGEVKIVDKTKMEVVREEKKVKVWLRDLNDQKLAPSVASVKQLIVNLDDGSKEALELEAKEDHFEAEIKGPVNTDTLKIMMARLMVAGQEYQKLRVPRVIAPGVVKKGFQPKVPPMTAAKAIKKESLKAMKGTIGTIKVKNPPAGTVTAGKRAPVKPVVKPAAAPARSSKTKKAAVSKAKKAQ